MNRPQVGSTVVDASRPELGRGVLRSWINYRRSGVYAAVKFATSVRYVRRANCKLWYKPRAPKEKPVFAPLTEQEAEQAAFYGLTHAQYRDAMQP